MPVVYYLSGLTCTDENFVQKAGAQRAASELGLALVAPDTSPRGLNVPGEADAWDFGVGAGFYLNATQEKWAAWRMYDFVLQVRWGSCFTGGGNARTVVQQRTGPAPTLRPPLTACVRVEFCVSGTAEQACCVRWCGCAGAAGGAGRAFP